MDIKRVDIVDYINGYSIDEQDLETLKQELYDIYNVDGDENKIYVIDLNVESIVKENISNQKVYNERKEKLKGLKLLELPEQRSPEWYEMRKEKLTASSLASAIGKCHFTTREELILSKIEDKPYESNPITEWGVKYEDIAILFYEEMYNVKVLDFGLIPHPTFKAFGASPDGICDDTGNDEYVARMVEIKCPPKRKFTKTCPPHYLMQVQGQLEVCNLEECDYLECKLSQYKNQALENFKTKEKWTFEDSYVRELEEFERFIQTNLKNKDKHKYYVHLSKADELLKFDGFLEFLDVHQIAHFKLEYESDHRFDKIKDVMRIIVDV